jgi:hypothetical protein
MTKEEFTARQQDLIPQKPKRWGVAYLVAVGAMFAGLCVLIISDYKHWAMGWLGLSCLAVLVLFPRLLRWYMSRRFGVRCPSCGKPLDGADAGIALFSGYCWYCHKRIVSEKAEPSSSANSRPAGGCG